MKNICTKFRQVCLQNADKVEKSASRKSAGVFPAWQTSVNYINISFEDTCF